MLVFLRILFHSKTGIFKFCQEIFIRHVEVSVIFLENIKSFTQFLSPPWVTVTPISFPLSLPPWVSQLQKSYVRSLIIELKNAFYCVSVALDDAFSALIGIGARLATCHQYIILKISYFHVFPKFIFLFLSFQCFMNPIPRWNSLDMKTSHRCCSTLDCIIRAVQFCPSFFS